MSDHEPAAKPSSSRAAEVTRLLREWKDGDEDAFDSLVPLVYDELKRVASRQLGGESRGHTLHTTALVHEAYVRLAGADVSWENTGHFMRIAARAMRRVLVDHARRRKSQKRGEGNVALELDSLEGVLSADARPEDLLDLDEALERLLALEERKGRVIELHYFGGLAYEEVAAALEISPATVHRDLRMARAWLFKELKSDHEGG